MIYPNSGEILEPMVYKVKKDKKGYYLEKHLPRFNTPLAVYGSYKRYPDRFWKRFNKGNTNLGLMLIGAKGGGKSLLAELIGNRAIDSGNAVVLVSDLSLSADVGKLIEKLSNVVVILDEFGKLITFHQQGRLLGMFSINNGNKKLFIITENHINRIEPNIVDRPGRMLYRIDFNKLDDDTYAEFLATVYMDPVFREHLDRDFLKASTFSFDHLRAIAEEHSMYPEEPYKDIVKILNISMVGIPSIYEFNYMIDLENPEKQFKLVNRPRPINEDIVNQHRDNVVLNEIKEGEENTPKEEPPARGRFGGFGGGGPDVININIEPNNILRLTDSELVYSNPDKKYELVYTKKES